MNALNAIAREIDRAQRKQGGRPRSAPITMPVLETMKERHGPVAVAQALLHRQADPLGIVSGDHQKRHRAAVGDATPERRQHAKAAGVRLQGEAERFEDGRRTGLERKRFVSKLESLKSHGALTSEGYHAACLFRQHADMAAIHGPRQSAMYVARMIDGGGVPELLPAERACDNLRKVALARAAVPHELWPVLSWIEASSNDEIGIDEVAAAYWPELAPRTREGRFLAHLELTCALLARHYGLTARHRWAKLQISRAAKEIADRIGLAA